MVNELENYNKKDTEEKEIIKDIPMNSEKKENNEGQKPEAFENVDKIEEVKEDEKDKKKSQSIFSLSDFFLYKITCGKKNSDLGIYEDSMKNIISVENLFHNYLEMNNLLKSENKFENNTCIKE